MGLKLKLLVLAGVVVGMTGCSPQPANLIDSASTAVATPVATEVAADVVEAPLAQAPVSLPSSWSSQEVSLWNTLASFYPTIASMDNAGKNALMNNVHLTCQAYSEGYSRIEIFNASNSVTLPSGLIDDTMTLAVTTFCPQYTDLQLR